MSAERTPTPWTVINEDGERLPGIRSDGVVIVESGSEYYGAGVRGPNCDGRANAAFIVRAVNSHEELVELLRLAFQTLLIARLDHDLRARISIALAKLEGQS